MGDSFDVLKVSRAEEPLVHECLLLYVLPRSRTAEIIIDFYKVRYDKILVVKGLVTSRDW